MSQRKWYEITKKGGEFEVSIGSKVIFTMKCDELIECEAVLFAKTDGLYSLYMPSYTKSASYGYYDAGGFVCVLENIQKFYHYKKYKDSFNSGYLLIKVKTGDSCGYWTVIDIASDPNKIAGGKPFQIFYKGNSEGRFMEEFDYLSLSIFIKIDNRLFFITKKDSNHGGIISKELYHMKVEPLPFSWYFKLISEKGESFCSRLGSETYTEQFGPFYKISKANLSYYNTKKLPDWYFAQDENGNILGMAHGYIGRCFGKDTDMITFDSPVKEAKLIETFECADNILVAWKLTYLNGTKKMYLCSIISRGTYLSKLFDIADYI